MLRFNSLSRVLRLRDPALLQVGALLPMLKRGVGVHHSGLLPILKEIIEILFQENLIKARSHPLALSCSSAMLPCHAHRFCMTCTLACLMLPLQRPGVEMKTRVS